MFKVVNNCTSFLFHCTITHIVITEATVHSTQHYQQHLSLNSMMTSKIQPSDSEAEILNVLSTGISDNVNNDSFSEEGDDVDTTPASGDHGQVCLSLFNVQAKWTADVIWIYLNLAKSTDQ